MSNRFNPTQGAGCGCEEKKEHFCKLITRDKKLCGVKYELRARCGCLIACGRTNEHGELKFDKLPFGTYILTEIESAKGFVRDPRPITVEICDDKPHKVVETVNHRETGDITVIKTGRSEKFVCEDEDEDC